MAEHIITLEIRKQIGTYRVLENDDGLLGPVYRKCFSPKTGRRYETLCVAYGRTAYLVREALRIRMAA